MSAVPSGIPESSGEVMTEAEAARLFIIPYLNNPITTIIMINSSSRDVAVTRT